MVLDSLIYIIKKIKKRNYFKICFCVYWQVKQSIKEIGQNVTTRVKLYMKAFCAEDATSATASVSQARELARSSSKLHQTIKRYQVSIYFL